VSKKLRPPKSQKSQRAKTSRPPKGKKKTQRTKTSRPPRSNKTRKNKNFTTFKEQKRVKEPTFSCKHTLKKMSVLDNFCVNTLLKKLNYISPEEKN
jgi:hypothetical protein